MYRIYLVIPLPNLPVPPPRRSWSVPQGLLVPRFYPGAETLGRIEAGIRRRVLPLLEPWEPHHSSRSGSRKILAPLPTRRGRIWEGWPSEWTMTWHTDDDTTYRRFRCRCEGKWDGFLRLEESTRIGPQMINIYLKVWLLFVILAWWWNVFILLAISVFSTGWLPFFHGGWWLLKIRSRDLRATERKWWWSQALVGYRSCMANIYRLMM